MCAIGFLLIGTFWRMMTQPEQLRMTFIKNVKIKNNLKFRQKTSVGAFKTTRSEQKTA